MADLRPIAIICGPTASGKTSLALDFAGQYSSEIISADSRQIIRHLDIGTAKPTAEERQQCPFHLVDIVEPGERYSAFQFITDASNAIVQILGRNRIPLLVGGTGLYLRALTDGVVEIDAEDMAIRDNLERQFEQDGPEKMHELLQKVDPLEAAKVHPNNRQRLIRALEIFYLTGKSKSELVTTGAYKVSRYTFDYYCLAPPREELYAVINDRVDQMMQAGWLEEIEALLDRGLAENLRRARVIGYSELQDHIEGRLSLDEALALIKQNTRRYAKRQMTWFRRQKGCKFFENREELLRQLMEKTAN